MRSGRPLVPFELSAPTRKPLPSLANSRSTPHGLVRRAEIVLLAAEGWPHEAIGGAVGVSRVTVGKWRRRFLDRGLNGLHDELRPGAPRSITDEQVAEVIYKTLKTQPKDQTQWSLRSMGAETRPHQGRGPSHLAHGWFAAPSAQDLQTVPPIRSSSEKVRDDRRSVSESSPSMPWCCASTRRVRSRPWSAPSRCGQLGLGYVEGVTHDYKRQGTTTLFAALNNRNRTGHGAV